MLVAGSGREAEERKEEVFNADWDGGRRSSQGKEVDEKEEQLQEEVEAQQEEVEEQPQERRRR